MGACELLPMIPQYKGLTTIPLTIDVTGALIAPRSNGANGA